MRYLIHSASGAYDATTGVTTHVIEQRVPNPTVMVVRRVLYLGQESPPPHHVYCRSNALSALAQHKHTVELKSTGPESASNVIAVLPESFAIGRYETKSETVYPVLGHVHLRSIDIFFTEGSRLLTPAATAGSSSVPTAAEIAARSDLFLFLNYTDSTKITIDEDPFGDMLSEIEAVNDPSFEFIPNSGSGIQYSDFGTNGGKSVVFNNDWVRLNDGSTVEEPGTGTLCLLFKTQPNTTDVQVMTDWYRWRIYVNAGGVLSYYDGAIQETSIAVSNSTDYLLSVRRDDDASTFVWRLEDLSDNSTQTDSTANGDNSPGTGLFDIGGNSSYSAAGSVSSNLVLISSVADSDVEAVELYLRDYYEDQGVSGGGASSGEYLVELEIDSH